MSAKKEPIIKVCDVCEKKFQISRRITVEQRDKRQCCSMRCNQAHRRISMYQIQNPYWKGKKVKKIY